MEVCYARFQIEHLKNSNNPKQCYPCQRYVHASETCNFTPKCVKCSGSHHTPDCPSKGGITHICANCGAEHPTSYRGCPKNLLKLKKNNVSGKNNAGSCRTDQPNNPASNNSLDFAAILNEFNYVGKLKNNLNRLNLM